jgi:hypothetical protein
MDGINNKYELKITKRLFDSYISLLIDSIFKLLPIYEGLSKSKEIVYSSEQSYKHYQQHLEKILIEITGDYYIFYDIPEFIKLLTLIQGMIDINIDEHDTVRSMVFECIKICENIKNQTNENNLEEI